MQRQNGAREQQDERSPFIPRHRFDEVNTKLNELKAWKEQRAWADQIDGTAFQTMAQWYGQAVADPRQFALNLLDELSKHPDHAPHVRSELARRLGTRQQQQAAGQSTEIVPEVVVTDANGQEVGRTYSDRQIQQLRDQIREQTLAEIDTRYADKFSTLEQIKAREQQAQAEAQATQFAASFVSELSQLPMFAEHKAAIGEYLQAHPPASDHPADVQANAYRAYYAVVGSKLATGSSTQQAVLADLQRKAQASTGVNPGAASSASPKAVTSFHDKSLQW